MAEDRRPRLCLLAREPAPGRVKTRLAAAIGPRRAAAHYAAVLHDQAAAHPSRAWTCGVAHAGRRPGPRLRRLFRAPWFLQPQGGGTLGERLARASRRAFRAGAPTVLLAGSDAPTLSAPDIVRALSALRSSDLVLAPAPDGGFSLAGLGLRADASRLFARVRWSTRSALADVRRNGVELGLRVALLPPVPDVDVAADLPPLRRRLGRKGRRAPATRALLATL